MANAKRTARKSLWIVLGFALLASLQAGAGAPPGPADALRSVARRTGPAYFPHARQVAAAEDDRTLAPYFHVPSGSAEHLPLKETGAEVDIAGVIARVRVRQVYENHSKQPIEAVYVFPASTRAAVHGMRMKIGSRTIEARIERRQKARDDYQRARTAGQRASLLEQQRENVFTMNVANLMPNDRIEVEIDYSELLVPEDAVYEFVYPTVVGPRYGGGADPAKDRWIASPYLHQGQAEPYRFDISAHLRTSIPIKDVSSPSHAIDATYPSASTADVRLKAPGGGNRDFVLRYRLAGDRIETGLLLWDGPDGGTFALMMEPPRRPAQADIPRREFVFLVDVSGSMTGFPLDTAKTLMRKLLGSLRPTDRFDVVLFAGASHVMSPKSVPATEANVLAAIEMVDRQRGGGGTELMAGLSAAYGVGGNEAGVAQTVVVITDGFVGVEAHAFRFIRERLDETSLFSFGIGNSVNRALIEGMARAGEGESFVVLNATHAEAQAERFRAAIDRPVLTDIRVKIRGLDTYDVLPDKVPDLLAERPVVVMGRYRGRAQGSFEVSGRTGRGAFQKTVEVRASDAHPDHAPLGWLWARRWVATLDDELAMGATQELEDAITDLGLRHSLLTRFTSFLAVDSQVVNRGGQATTVQQPVPLPEGVQDEAVGLGYSAGAASLGARKMRSRAMFESSDALMGSSREGDPAMMSPPRSPPRRVAPSKSIPMVSRHVVEIPRVRAEALDGAARLERDVIAALGQNRCGLLGEVRVRLTIDAKGKITSVVVVKGPGALGQCVTATLRGLGTGARPRGRAATTTVDLTIRIR